MFFDLKKSTVGTLVVTCVLTFFGSIYAQNIVTKGQPVGVTILDSTKEQDGLTGSVRRVRTESAKLELEGERLIEGSRQLVEVTTYSPGGNRVENVSYPFTSSLVGKEEYKYDAKGNIVEMTLRDEKGTILSKEAYDYEFDRFGNWTKMVTNLIVFEGGKLKHEPIQVTYRALTYYFDDAIAKIVEPALTQKVEELPVATQLAASYVPVLASGLTSESNSGTLSAPLVSGFDPPPDPNKPEQPEKKVVTRSDLRETPRDSSIAGFSSSPEFTEAVETAKAPASAPGPEQLAASGATGSPELTSTAERRPTREFVINKPPTTAKPGLLNSSSTPLAASERESAENVAGTKAPGTETDNKQGFEYFKVGRNKFDDGDLKGALTAYLKSIELQPDSAEVHMNLGLVYLKLEKNKDAVKAFKNSVRLQPKVAEAQYGLGLADFRLGRHKDAADAFKQAIVLRPDMAKAHYGLALAYQELGKIDAVGAEFRILQTLDASLAKRLSQSFPEFNFPCGSSSRCR
jgi:TolA-binding protein